MIPQNELILGNDILYNIYDMDKIVNAVCKYEFTDDLDNCFGIPLKEVNYKVDYDIPKHIKYLHQLQNYHFFKTNKLLYCEINFITESQIIE